MDVAARPKTRSRPDAFQWFDRMAVGEFKFVGSRASIVASHLQSIHYHETIRAGI
jgi:hypothetical protein